MEQLMQYIWNHRLWLQPDMVTTDGRKVQVIDQGRLNTDSGPDFFNAKIAIGGEIWVGNVEIHVRASDWHRHGHDNDPAYENVILHVVDSSDAEITLPGRKNPLPQLIMPCSPDLGKQYSRLVEPAPVDNSVSCAEEIAATQPIYLRDWLDALAFERLHSKAERINDYLRITGGDWDQAAFAAVARAFGSGINGDMFERTALSLPLRAVGRHNDSTLMTDAMIFGQACLLDDAPMGEYPDALRREYAFLRTKFGLEQPKGILWKMARMRPANFPHRRLAQLSKMLQDSVRIMSRALDIAHSDNPLNATREWLDNIPTGFWTDHYTFSDAPVQSAPAAMSAATIATILINAVVPLAYAYAVSHGSDTTADRAIDILQTLPAENNAPVRLFRLAGMPCTSAFDSQAIIQLRRCYCEQRKCLYCRIGHRALARKARRGAFL